MILGIDPGPVNCGLARYDNGRVTLARKDATIDEALREISLGASLVRIERVQSYGISGGTLLRTSEVVGRLLQRALDCGHPVELIYRREVLARLDIGGKGNRDALVRARLIEMHGGTKRAACGIKKAPGPLYGVSGHAWQALGVALAGER